MKNLSLSIWVVALVALLAGASSAQSPRLVMTVDVPFGFVVGNTALPAGEYAVYAGYWPARVIRIQNVNTKQNMFSVAIPSRNKGMAQASELVFHRYGDNFFLRKLTLSGYDDSTTVPESKLERELELAAAGTTVKVPTVQMAKK
jgi:hypothetical protein